VILLIVWKRSVFLRVCFYLIRTMCLLDSMFSILAWTMIWIVYIINVDLNLRKET